MSAIRLRHTDALLPTTAVLIYILTMYCSGFALLLQGTWWSWPLGVLAVAHAMVIASYLVHECAHNAVFVDAKHNALLGRVLLWINGASYSDYEAIRHKHLRHHVDRADVIAIDYHLLLQRHTMLHRVIVTLERIYIPAVDCLMHALVIVLPFIDERYRAQRRRVLFNLVMRGALLIALCIYSWQAFAGYLLAYCLFEIVLRILDMHQHTFEVFINLDQPRGAVRFDKSSFDKNYEQRNTYSNPLGRGVLANWLVLNFGFHNAHHEKPALPWYRLPALDRELRGTTPVQPLRFRAVLNSYSKYRVERVMNVDYDEKMGAQSTRDNIGFIGVLGVSFLTPI